MSADSIQKMPPGAYLPEVKPAIPCAAGNSVDRNWAKTQTKAARFSQWIEIIDSKHEYRSRLKFLLRILLFATTLAMPGWSAAVTTDMPVGSITKLKGTAYIDRGDKKLDAILELPVLRNDKVETSSDGQLTVTLHGGSELTLRKSSSMVIDQNMVSQDSSIIHLLGGVLRARVNAMKVGSVTNFEVHTPNAVASARGTDFEVTFIEGKPCPEQPSCLRYTTVGVYEGIVDVTNPASPPGTPPVKVTVGYQTNVPCETPPSSPSPWGIEELGTPGYH